MPGGSETLPARIRGCVRGWRPFSSSLVGLLYVLQPPGQSWLPVTLHLSPVSISILREQPRLWPSVSPSLTLSLSSVHLFGLRLFSAAIPNYTWFLLFFVKFFFCVCVQTIFKLFTEFFFFYNIASVFCFFFHHKSCGIWAPRPGIEPTAPALEGAVLTTGLPGKSPVWFVTQASLAPCSRLGFVTCCQGTAFSMCKHRKHRPDCGPGSGSRSPCISPGQGPRRLASPQTCSDNPGPASRSLSPCLAEDAGWLWKPRAVYSSADANKRDPNGPGRTRQEGAKLFCTHGSLWHKTLNIFNNWWIPSPWSMPKQAKNRLICRKTMLKSPHFDTQKT